MDDVPPQNEQSRPARGSRSSKLSPSNSVLKARLHPFCSEICLQVEELGACLYPPQEIESLRERTAAIEEKVNNVDDIVHEAVEGDAGADCKKAIATVLQACHDLQALIDEGIGRDEEES
jgi:hypothetical protein